MSLATRCPSCNTTFKVVRDQLRISDGWVRCGRCSHVFDATLELHEMADGPLPVAPAPAPAPAPVPAPAPAPVAAAPVPTAPSHAEREEPEFVDDEAEGRETPPAATPEADDEVEPDDEGEVTAPAFSLPAHGIAPDALWPDFEVNTPESEWRPPPSSLPPFPNIDLDLAAAPATAPAPPPPLPLPALRLEARELAESARGDEEEAHEPSPDRDRAQLDKVLRRTRIKSDGIAHAREREEERVADKEATTSSMVRQASEPELDASAPQPFRTDDAPDSEPLALLFENDRTQRRPSPIWQRPAVRRSFWLLVVLAVLLLAVQVLRHERDAIVRQPGLRPALAALCHWSGCELTALRRIGDIVIEGAAFTREKSGGGDYRLSFTLRNGAAVPLAMPAIELSLLDSQERAVVRRVLTAADYGAPAVLAARADHAASLPLSLSAPESTTLPPIAGYRVEAFYP
jgi:predicted Zn finger-like uncharacterized protein